MARYHGGKGRVMLSPTGAGTAVTVTMSQWTLDKTTDKADVTSFGDTNKVSVIGLPNLQGNLSAFFDDLDDSMFDGAESADGVKLYLYPSSDALTIYHYGPAWMDASMDVPVNGAVSIAGTYVAKASWGRKP